MNTRNKHTPIHIHGDTPTERLSGATHSQYDPVVSNPQRIAATIPERMKHPRRVYTAVDYDDTLTLSTVTAVETQVYSSTPRSHLRDAAVIHRKSSYSSMCYCTVACERHWCLAPVCAPVQSGGVRGDSSNIFTVHLYRSHPNDIHLVWCVQSAHVQTTIFELDSLHTLHQYRRFKSQQTNRSRAPCL